MSPGGWKRGYDDQLETNGLSAGQPGTVNTGYIWPPSGVRSKGSAARCSGVSGTAESCMGAVQMAVPACVNSRAVFMCEKWSV